MSLDMASDGKEGKMKEYHLYVSGSHEAVFRAVKSRWDYATIIPTIGLWEGKVEDSWVVVVLDPPRSYEGMRQGASDVAQELGQQCVLLTYHEVEGGLVGA